MNDEHLRQQSWLIHSALASTRSVIHGSLGRDAPRPKTSRGTPTAKSAARAIALELVASQLANGGGASWIGLQPVNERRDALVVGPVGADLYDGTAGIALFLGQAGRVLDDERFRCAAEHAIASARAERDELAARGLGGFTGAGGLIFALAHLGSLWGDASMHHEAAEFSARVGEIGEAHETVDIVDGLAGFLLGVLALDAAHDDARLVAIARRCGEALLGRARFGDRGLSWPSGEEPALLGFSHGNAGIGCALARLAARTGEAVYRDAAMAAFRFENSHYSRDAANWPDMRAWGDDAAGESFVTAWCHGAPGIGLARLAAHECSGDARLLPDIDRAIATTLAAPMGESHCLCHGDLGNLDVLLSAARVLDDESLADHVRRRGLAVVADGASNWRCGLPLAVRTPGLMNGIAGIGYGLLRLIDGAVPSVLALEAPVR